MLERAKKLLDEALDRPESERHEFVRTACGDDQELLREVTSLLEALQAAGTFLDQPLLGRPKPAGPESPLEGRRIGEFQIVAPLAVGGMGTVYEATQDHPQRKVALKILKNGLLDSQARRRFEFESQVLGRLRHPGIAQIIHAGTFEHEGETRPYFAMEFIEGAMTLTEYCNRHTLSVEDKIRLFLEVLEAVHHGHLRGVIHRDLKPGNILVDGNGRAKVIDFGIARSTDSELSTRTLQTHAGQLLGTLQYMSPEQCEADPDEIDVRSDLYSLGVVFYELLTDSLPYRVESLAILEALRTIKEESPKRPSTVLQLLRGDLETILLKTLEKERQRRYQSAPDLAADLNRFLDHEPIEARRASYWYQLSLFARRNKALVGVASVSALALVVATGVSIAFAFRAREEAESRRQAQLQTEDEASNVEVLNRFLLSIFSQASPQGNPNSRVTTIKEAVKRSVADAPELFAGKPILEGKFRMLFSDLFHSLEEYEDALAHARTALELNSKHLGPNDLKTLDSMRRVTQSLLSLHRLEEAETLLAEVYQLQRTHHADQTVLLGDTLIQMALVQVIRNDGAAAIPPLEESLQYFPVNDLEALKSRSLALNLLGVSYTYTGQLEAASDALDQALSLRRRILETPDPALAETLSSLGELHIVQQDFFQAEQFHRESLDMRVQLFGRDNPSVARTMNNIAMALKGQGCERLEEASDLLRESIDILRGIYPAGHPVIPLHQGNLTIVLFDLSNCLRDSGQREQYAHTLLDFAQTQFDRGAYGEAVHRFRQCGQEAEKLGDLTLLVSAKVGLATSLARQEDYEDAEELLFEAEELVQEEELSEVQPTVIRGMIALYRAWGQDEEAEAWEFRLEEVEDSLDGS